jgi:hypothetical protein
MSTLLKEIKKMPLKHKGSNLPAAGRFEPLWQIKDF